MDPGAALGLAQTVWTLVFFGLDFVKDVKRVYGQGNTDLNQDLSTTANHIRSVTRSLEAELARNEEDTTDDEDEELRDLAVRASEVGKELLDALTTSRLGDKKSRFKAFKAAARSHWDAEDIERVEKRLNNIQNVLQLRVIVSIKRKVDRLPDGDLRGDLSLLEKVLNLQSASREDVSRLLDSLNNNIKLGERNHRELLVSIRELKALTLTRSASLSQGNLELSIRETKKAIAEAEAAVLNSLWYQSMRDREDSIYDPHRKTLEWLYKDPISSDKPWDSFVQFLQGDGKAYWITGKPGSGKSTVMKFLKEDERTKENLRIWASGKEIRVASFYFFYNGSDLQKSEVGLLLSLLHTLLSEDRSLIPVVFSEQYNAVLYSSATISRPSVLEAKRALKRIFIVKRDVRFFLTIDGLDEFDQNVSLSNVSHLLDLTETLADFPNVKLVLSSRPEPKFEAKFALYPKLMVHNLTKDDVSRYVRESLEKHPQMKALLSEDPQSRRLIGSIVLSASGVFLWVRLVIESLIDGLTEGDGLHELQQRVETLPSDLFDLYRVMLSRVEHRYLSQTAKILRLVQYAKRLTAISLWFAENASEKLVWQTPVSPMSEEQLEYRVEQMKQRVKSRSRGLLEVTLDESKSGLSLILGQYSLADRSKNALNKHLRFYVTFIHRSVVEFLQRDEIHAEFIDHPALSGFHPEIALFYSDVLLIKTFMLDSGAHWLALLKLAFSAGSRALFSKPAARGAFAEIFDVLDTAMTQHLALYKASPNRPTGGTNPFEDEPLPESHWTAWYDLAKVKKSKMHLRTFRSFAAFAASNDLTSYLKHKVAIYGLDFLRNGDVPLLGHVIMARYPWLVLNTPTFETVKYLVELGNQPTAKFLIQDIWHDYLCSLGTDGVLEHDMHQMTFPGYYPGTHLDVLALLIPLGVDVNIPIPHKRIWRKDKDEMPKTEVQTLLTAVLPLRSGVTSPRNDWIKKVDRVINLLRERGAIEKVWD